jgi:hypothetical protein
MTLAPLKPRADRQLEDTRILQKVNGAHREAFAAKYDGQIEHILRLLCERLHNGLDKRDGVDISDVATWRLTPSELADLSESVYHMHLIRESLKDRNAKTGI